MQIISSRCIIRPFQSHEIDSFMVYRNDAEWMKYQGFKGLTKEDYEAELLGVLTLARGIQLAIVNKLTQVLIGDIYLHQQCNVFWLGYTISPAYARQGYAIEAITATIDWIKENGFSLIKAGVNPENILSIKLLIRIGFNFSGIEDGEHVYVLDLTKGE
ncbi:GNAT family N-acetyltransferase [Enterobacter sp. SAT-E-asb]|uniref:GNAT family N-acetyltransferase n=1 Tax=Enterobacteriaceae TaxID=543 RepID=UPI001CD032D2|nr:GNAT family N-acetyltransferase [Klebsiella grimontii]ELA2276318.1 GNAT family N-acetyltransferase [Klebsiella aerogenes]MBZ7226082.1 GNAT family N-acetyltransferase [Klebsiella grimontii]